MTIENSLVQINCEAKPLKENKGEEEFRQMVEGGENKEVRFALDDFNGDKESVNEVLDSPITQNIVMIEARVGSDSRKKIWNVYKKMRQSAESVADELIALGGEMFFEKDIDKKEIIKNIEDKALRLLEIAREKIDSLKNSQDNSFYEKEFNYTLDEREKNLDLNTKEIEDLIAELIADIVRIDDINRKELENLKNLAGEINKLLSEVTRSVFEKEVLESFDKASGGRADIQWLVEREMKNIKTMAKAQVPEGFDYLYNDFLEKFKKFDKERIEKMIIHYRGLYSMTEEDENNLRDNLKDTVPTFMLEECVQEAKKVVEDSPDIAPFKNVYEPLVRKLENVLDFQETFEDKFDELVYGKKDILQEKTTRTTAELVFKKYDEIVALAQKSRKEIASIFKNEKDLDNDDLDKITAGLVKRASVLLKNHVDGLAKDEEISEEEVMKKLASVEADLVLKLSILKNLDNVRPEDIKGLDFEMETAQEMIGDDLAMVDRLLAAFIRKGSVVPVSDNFPPEEGDFLNAKYNELWQMTSIYKENWQDFSEDEQQFLIKKFIQNLREAGADSRIYKYKNYDKVLSFMRVDDTGENKKGFAAFNCSSSARGGRMGENLLQKVLEREGDNCLIEANCVQKDHPKDISFAYVEKYGFVITGIEPNLAGLDWSPFKIERKKDNDTYYYRRNSYTEEDLVEIYKKELNSQAINQKGGQQKFISRVKGVDELLKMSGAELEKGYTITRYFKKGDYIYCAFEQ